MRSPIVSTLVILPGVLGVGAIGCASSTKGDAGNSHVAAPGHGGAHAASPDEARRRLEDGNQRFATGHSRGIADYSSRRTELAKGQQPFAVIVSCSDSRAGPEVIFDQGLGDLFVIRTAGHVVDDEALGSIEYAVEHLGSPLIVVLGHSRCGAVTAAVEGGTPPGHIGAVTRAIQPAVDQTRGKPGDPVDNAVRANVRDVVQQLREAGPILSEFAHEGKLKVVGACYNLDTGRVDYLE